MKKSLKLQLLVNLMLFLTIAWLVTLGLGYVLTKRTLNRQLDNQLRTMAESLSNVTVTNESNIEVHKSATITDDEGRNVEYQIWQNERMISYSANGPQESLAQAEGYSENNVGDKDWKVFSIRAPNGRLWSVKIWMFAKR